jgi:tRNA(Ile)-lysidine synthase
MQAETSPRARSTGRVIALAYSGGRDSTALLHATLAAAAPLGIQVCALHVHHGLSEHADAWLQLCADQCARWARRGWPVVFDARALAGKPEAGVSVEAWAREHRYRALRSMATAHGASLVLLAHHRLDQAETFLLQALRGAGVAGLSGMPRSAIRDGITWARPWLDQPRQAIDSYLRAHRLRFIDDDSNTDARYARNRLRLHVWPELAQAFVQAESALARSAHWAQEAAQCLAELAALDLASVSSDRGLNVAAWNALSTARRGNALRAWLRAESGAPPPASLVARLLGELQRTRTGSWPCATGSLRLYRGNLNYRTTAAAAIAPPPETQLHVRRCGIYKLPGWAGQLRVQRTTQAGVPMAWLGQLELRPRGGGEQFQAGLGRPPRSLKKQYQAAAVPPWLRDGPLFFSGGQLLFAPGLGLDARVWALPGQPLVTLEWQGFGVPPALPQKNQPA